jgi:hypothetical protein
MSNAPLQNGAASWLGPEGDNRLENSAERDEGYYSSSSGSCSDAGSMLGIEEVDTASLDIDASWLSARVISRALPTDQEDRKRAPRHEAWSCYRAMGQTGRALALAGVTMATMLGAMNISGVPFTSADLQAPQRLDMYNNSLLGQLRWWCYHGDKWKHISQDFEKAGLLSCHQLLTLADLQAKPFTGPATDASSPTTAPTASSTAAPTSAGDEPYACAAEYHKVGVGVCYGTIDNSGQNQLAHGNIPKTDAECEQLCTHHQKYYTIVQGKLQCVGYNFHTLTEACVLYTGSKPTSLSTHENTTVCCASNSHG